MMTFLRAVRRFCMLRIKPKGSYFFFRVPQKHVTPLSTKFGFDRGTPIDRYYIEQFLEQYTNDIHGTCLEVHDTAYLQKFGGSRVTRADALDIDTTNHAATVYGDLRNLSSIASNTYDCLVITHTFGVIDDVDAAVAECARILKPGGVLLATMTAIGPAQDIEHNFWRFTVASGKYLFRKHFPQNMLRVKSYGNVLSGQCFWVGAATEELTEEELAYNDPHFPLIVTVRAVKEGNP